MEWQFGADNPVPIRVIIDQIFTSDYTEISDDSIFVPKQEYDSQSIKLDTPACVSGSTSRDAGEWTYYLELALIKDLLEGFDNLDQALLDRITHYAIYDDFPD